MARGPYISVGDGELSVILDPAMATMIVEDASKTRSLTVDK